MSKSIALRLFVLALALTLTGAVAAQNMTYSEAPMPSRSAPPKSHRCARCSPVNGRPATSATN